MPKPKLNKGQSKRFDEKFPSLYEYDDDIFPAGSYTTIQEDVKQHLADELAKQKKEHIEKLEKMKEKKGDYYWKELPTKVKIHNKVLDQAIKSLK